MRPISQTCPPTRSSETAADGIMNSALRFMGRTLEVTGATNYMGSVTASAYDYLTGAPSQPTRLKNKSPLIRKARKLRQESRPYSATTGYRFFDWLGYDQTPAILSYHSRGKKVNYNGKVLRERHGDLETIECRHLAYAYASGKIGRKETKFQEVATENKMANSPVIPDDEFYLKEVLQNASCHDAIYFTPQTLPDVLYALAREASDHERKDYLFSSINHIIALSFIKKREGSVTLYFYDPNDTCRHRKVMVRSVEDLKYLGIEDWLSEDKEEYFPKGLESACLLSLETEKTPENRKVRLFCELDKGTVSNLGRFGHYGAADTHGHPIRLDKTADKALLSGNNDRGAPALYLAAQNGHHEAFETLIQDTLSSNLGLADKIDLLTGARLDGVPALYIAAQRGHEKVIKVYIQAILSSDLDPTDKIRLLAAKHPCGTPALSIAIKQKKQDVVTVYVQEVLDSDLDQAGKGQLLAALALVLLPT